MKLSIIDTLCPGRSLKDKVELLEDLGFDGIEIERSLWGSSLLEKKKEVKSILSTSKLKLSNLLAGYRGDLLAADRKTREMTIEDIKARLKVCAELGGVGVVTVPSFLREPEIPDLFPWIDRRTVEQSILREEYKILAKFAEDAGVYAIIEPMDRSRTHIVHTLQEAAKICEESCSEKIGICPDSFHMNIEEPNMAESLKEYSRLIVHVHIGDSDPKRQFARLPGSGNIDFKRMFEVLRTNGYERYLSFDCKIEGKSELCNSVRYVKRMM